MIQILAEVLEDPCEDLLPIINVVKNAIIPIIEFGIPIAIILLGTIDLVKAVIASKEDEMKTAQKLLIKRIIYGIAIFFVTLIVTVAFNLLAETKDSNIEDASGDWLSCWNRAG